MAGRSWVSCTEEAVFREGFDRRNERYDSSHIVVLLRSLKNWQPLHWTGALRGSMLKWSSGYPCLWTERSALVPGDG